jgi:hypothetical protein
MAEEHIKINPVPTKVKYSGNGVVREFPTGFAFFEDDNIVVYHNGVIINTGYSVTGVGETDGGVVTFDAAPAEGDKIVIIRKVAIERVTDFQEGGAFRAKNINDELDRQTAFCQQIQEEIDRCVKVEVTDDQTPEELLTEVYGKLDSATEVAQNAVDAATAATEAVASAEKTLAEVNTYVDESKAEIGALITKTTEEIDQTISDATEEIKGVAVNAANEAVQETIGASVIEAATSAEHARVWAEGEQAEVEPLGGELSSKGWALQASNSATSAAVSASEAEAIAGEVSIYNFKNKITNCITEMPQDIKLELNNGTLTLKAGSKVYVPNGFEADGVTPKFDYVTFESDTSMKGNWGTAEKVAIFVEADKTVNVFGFARLSSGTTSPTQTDARIWYDTTNNKIKHYSGGSLIKSGLSLPIAICNKTSANSDNIIDSIDQVFNGFGYIGSTVFVLPNVKGLMPNGRNADGTLKNIEFTTNRVLCRTFTKNYNFSVFLNPQHDGLYLPENSQVQYKETDNIIKNTVTGEIYYSCVLATGKSENSVITSFTPKQPFHAADYQEVTLKQNFQVVSTLPSSPQPDVFYFIPE